MRRRSSIPSFFVLGLLFAAACVTAGRVVPSAEELAGPGADLDALARGRAAYVRECAACHRMYWPDELSPRAWREIVPEMGERAGLSDRETEDLTLYLVAASQATRAP